MKKRRIPCEDAPLAVAVTLTALFDYWLLR